MFEVYQKEYGTIALEVIPKKTPSTVAWHRSKAEGCCKRAQARLALKWLAGFYFEDLGRLVVKAIRKAPSILIPSF